MQMDHESYSPWFFNLMKMQDGIKSEADFISIKLVKALKGFID
jgi:hypothetical protein